MSVLGVGEFHAFEADGQRFLYLVPSAAVFALDDPAGAVLDELESSPRERENLVEALAARFEAGGSASYEVQAGNPDQLARRE